MRKTILLIVWLIVPVVLFAYHYGPGQTRMSLDRAAAKIAEAKAFEAEGNWEAANIAWGEALAETPAEKTAERYQIRLAQARAQMFTGALPEAMGDMDTLLAEAQYHKADPAFLREVRGSLATAQYYAAWLMRLEGAEDSEWLLPVESARQNFRLLAETSKDAKSKDAYGKNLEATIRLAQMDLSELQGMPLPSFCSGAKNVSQKCRSQCESKSETKSEPNKSDARGAGFNDIPKGGS